MITIEAEISKKDIAILIKDFDDKRYFELNKQYATHYPPASERADEIAQKIKEYLLKLESFCE